jgi:hypothetical protein
MHEVITAACGPRGRAMGGMHFTCLIVCAASYCSGQLADMRGTVDTSSSPGCCGQ